MIVLVVGSEKQVKMCVGIFSQHKTSLVAKCEGVSSKCFSNEHHYCSCRIFLDDLPVELSETNSSSSRQVLAPLFLVSIVCAPGEKCGLVGTLPWALIQVRAVHCSSQGVVSTLSNPFSAKLLLTVDRKVWMDCNA